MASTRRSTSASRTTTKLPSFPSQKPPPRSRSSAGVLRRSSSVTLSSRDDGEVSGRVRVAIRLRPRNTEELVADADFADCVELQPEVKRLKLRKNNWDSDTYEFDELLTESASQKRVYEVVAKPVIESVLNGYNGTVMAYGQTGTGKTFTLGSLGEEDMAARGIMVRSMEDILADISPETDTVSVSYLQIYMETIQDLLHPGNDNIALVEDHKTGDVSISGATVVEIKDQNSFLELLRLGEAHRRVANTKMNTESSRSHAILMVHMRRSITESHESPIYDSCENGTAALLVKSCRSPTVRKSKLVIVDLAGSERMDKSGSDGHKAEEAKFINLSLSALGKCINALAENSSHVPIRDSKLTRLLRDSFGGTARTSLIVTIGPSPRHRAETTSTVMFGQRAMKVENMVKLKEEFDYKTLCRRLHIELDKLIADNERQRKNYDDDVQRLANDVQRIKEDAQMRIAEAERGYHIALEDEKMKCEKDYIDSIKKLEERWMEKQETIQKNANENASSCASESEKLSQIKELLKNETISRQSSEEEIIVLKNQILLLEKSETALNDDILKLRKKLEDEASQRKKLEEEISRLTSQLLQLSFEADETRRYLDNGDPKGFSGLDSFKQSHLRESEDGRKGSFSRLFEQAGLQKLLSLLESEDTDTQVHAVKVMANLAAEEVNQEKIVEAGGLTYLLTLLRGSKDETIRRVAAGAIANLAMNAKNQELIMDDGGTTLLAATAANAEDPQTLRMVAGAIANLCGNDKLQSKLSEEGGIKALLVMVRCSHPEVLAQVARGIANFAKCESKASSQGTKLGRSLLIGDGALPWLVKNASSESPPIRRHIELALCHLAQNEANAKEMIDEGAFLELTRISRDCSRQDIRTLANRTLTSNSIFLTELKRLQNDH